MFIPNVLIKVGSNAFGVSGGDSTLAWSADSLSKGAIITITTDGTYNFGTKPNAAKPLFVWDADDGALPDSGLGRATAWNSTFRGEANSTFTHGELATSYRYDLFDPELTSDQQPALAEIDFTSDEMYIHRIKYDDFDITVDFASRIAYLSLTGTLNVADTCTGSSSGATGIINITTSDTNGDFIYFENTGGTINDPVPTDFTNGETITTDGGASFTHSGGFPVQRTFNYKTVRLRNMTDNKTMHVSSQGTIDPHWYDTFEEVTGQSGAQGYATDVTQIADVWHTEEFIYTTSTLDTEDGEFFYLRDGQQYDTVNRFTNITTGAPNKYDNFVQTQVSNGCQVGSYQYYASVYADDSHCRVIISDSATLTLGTLDTADTDIQPFPPSAWSANSITLTALNGFSDKYFHVIDSTNTVVATGQFI